MTGEAAQPNNARFPRIRFSPEVGLGHLLQIAALVGAVLTAYIGVEKDIASLRADESVTTASFQRDIATSRADAQVVIASLDSRIGVVERAIVERRTEDREFASEMRAALDDFRKNMADLRSDVRMLVDETAKGHHH